RLRMPSTACFRTSKPRGPWVRAAGRSSNAVIRGRNQRVCWRAATKGSPNSDANATMGHGSRFDHSRLMPTIVLTPNLTGRDGVWHVSGLIVRACRDVAVLALHERTSLHTFEHATVAAAGGRNARYVALALQQAASTDADTTVIVVHLHLAPAALAFAA